jgi:excinuclease UvrABC helicase subunit UvrB
MDMEMQDYKRVYDEDVMFNSTNLAQKIYEQPQKTAKWAWWLREAQQEYNNYAGQKEEFLAKIVSEILAQSDTTLTKMTAEKMANAHPAWKEYQKRLKTKSIDLEYIAHAYENIKFLNGSLKTLVDFLKMESI